MVESFIDAFMLHLKGFKKEAKLKTLFLLSHFFKGFLFYMNMVILS